MIFFHPKDTRELIERFMLTTDLLENITQKNRRSRKRPDIDQAVIDNFALRFNLFRRMEKKEGDSHNEPKKYTVQCLPETRLSGTTSDLLKVVRQRQHIAMSEYKEHYPLCQFRGTLDWRMVVGLGGEHIQETSMTLHHVYGIPYIPGSAVKGMVRHYFVSEVLEPECRSETACFGAKDYAQLQQEFPEQLRLIDEICMEKDGEWSVNIASITESQKAALGEQLLNRLAQYVPTERLDILDNILSSPDLGNLLEHADVETLKKKFTLKGDNVAPKDLTIQKLMNNWEVLFVGQKIFGTQNQRGAIVFFDAYPASDVTFELDIINPHYPDYYKDGKKTSPHDSQNPKPVTFLTIAKTAFTFYLGQNIPGQSRYDEEQPLLENASQWLQKALQAHGIGAKSATGYGYFKDIADQTDILKTVITQRKQQEQELAEAARREALSPVDRLCEELSTLHNEHRSYEIFLNELDTFEGDEQKRLAEALKRYWKSIGRWKVKGEKQREKVERLKQILGE